MTILKLPNPRVVIVGAGFAGLTAARELRWAPVEVTLVDRNNYHLFTPLVYQVASALLDPSEVAQPVRRLVHRLRNCEFRQAEVTALDLDRKVVTTDRGDLPYDYLVVAAGSENDFLGMRSIAANSLSIKDLPDAMAVRNWVLDLFERWRWEMNPSGSEAALTIVVIGGGPTGVEYAGALAELTRLMLVKEFHRPDRSDARVVLIEASDRLLAGFDPRLSEAARRSLESKGVEVLIGVQVTDLVAGVVSLRDGRTIREVAAVWTAGVRGSHLGAHLGTPDRSGRIAVEPTLQLPGRPEVFVIGDLAATGLPMMAQPALQEARQAARNLRALVAGRPPDEFRYRDMGVMATIGRSSAVAQIGRVRLSGLSGWILWLFVHLLRIVTLRARAAILVNWAWNYLFGDRPVRILVRASLPPEPGAAPESAAGPPAQDGPVGRSAAG